MFIDLFILGAFIFLLVRGAIRGLWLSLLDPAAVILATAIAYYFLTQQHNIPLALAIGLLGPFIFYHMLKSFFKTGNTPSVLSRAFGSMITAAWGLIFLLPIIYLTTFLPPIHPALKTLNNNIKSSVIMSSLSKDLDSIFFHKKKDAKQASKAPASESQTEVAANPHNIPSLEEFLSDPRIVEITSDPKIRTEIQEKNYSALMSNPKIIKLMQDPEFIKRMMEELKKKQESENTQPK